MSKHTDLELALKIQAQFDEEAVRGIAESETSAGIRFDTVDNANGGSAGFLGSESLAKEPMSIVDQQWEMLDPSPDMRAMFLEFNDKYFWGRLAGVEVRWSPKMTLCAGLCCYEGQGGLCSIRLSAPLLKLRPRKDLVETLLHEMIHAYLFVTANNKDHDGHGPEFCKHMNRLNKSTGTNITIYHNFHDEVDVYRQHWWRCNGPCQKRPPYYGMVRRAMNRAPTARDPWWAGHQQSCGGSYTKVKEPEGYGAKKGTKRKKVESEDTCSSENESKKRATDQEHTSMFPGKGSSLGGSATVSRLIPPKHPTTLDKFLKKEDPKKTPVPPLPSSPPSSPRLQDQNEEKKDDTNNERRSTGSRRNALAAIFDSDDSDDDSDIVIVTIDKRQDGNASRYNDVREKNFDSERNARKSLQNNHVIKNVTNSPTSPLTSSVPKQESTSKTDMVSNSRSGTSLGNREDHGKKQESIINAFNRVRQRSGDGTNNDRNKLTGVGSSQMHNSSDVGPSQRNSLVARTEQGGKSSLKMVSCPACGCKVEQSRINAHLDQCLS